MVEKYGVKMTKEILPTLVNIVVPVGLSRTSLSRGVQVSLLFCVFHEIFQVSHPPAGGIFGNAINSSWLNGVNGVTMTLMAGIESVEFKSKAKDIQYLELVLTFT